MEPPGTARDLEQLATKLGRPPGTLSAFGRLAPEEVGLLSDLIDEACARRRRLVEAALEKSIPTIPRRLLIGVLRARGR